MMQPFTIENLQQWYSKQNGYSYPIVEATERGFMINDDDLGLELHYNSLKIMAIRPGVYVDPFTMHHLAPGTITSALALPTSLAKLSFCLGYFEQGDEHAHFTALPFAQSRSETQPDVLLRVDWSLLDLEKPVTELIFEQPSFGLQVIYTKVCYTDLYHDEGSSFFVLRNQSKVPNYGINTLYSYHLSWEQTLEQMSNRNFASYAEQRDEYYQKFTELVKRVSAVLGDKYKIKQTEEGVAYYRGFAAAYPDCIYYYDAVYYEAFQRHFDGELAHYERAFNTQS